MARVTVEDCIQRVTNRFELVLIATRRARQLARGATPLLDPENDKPTVIALREIAVGSVDASILDEEEKPELLVEEESAFSDTRSAALPSL